MSYVDGFVIPVPTKNLADYRRLAKMGAKIWMKYGAIAYHECVGDDLDIPFGFSFAKAIKLKRGETVVFSYIVYKSRAQRDIINAKVMKDPAMAKMPKKMPFDFKRMTWGGFKSLVEA